MTEQNPDKGQDDVESTPPASKAAAPAEPALVEAETVRLVLVPDAFTSAYIAHSPSVGQIVITTGGAGVPAAEAESITATAAGLGVVLKEED